MKKCAAVLIFNSKGELAMQKCAADDDRYPSRWDFAAGGHLEVGEGIEEGAKREMMEEIGIESPLEFIMEMHHPGGSDPDDEPDDLFIFRAVYDGEFHPDPKEVAEVRFFSLEQVKEMVATQAQTLHPEVTYFFNRFGKQLRQ